MLHRILTLARVSNLPTVWSNCLAAWIISGTPPSLLLLPVMAGASLLYAGGCTLNDAFDAKWDARHRPDRLIPSGQITARCVWSIGLAEMAAGILLIVPFCAGPLWPVLALAACILLYDAWHKQSPLSVITMGACRWLLYLSAAAAAGGHLTPVMLGGAILWLYIIILSLVARGEAKRSAGHSTASRWLLLTVPAAIGMLGFFWNGPRGLFLPVVLFSNTFAFMLPWRSRSVGQWVNRLLAAIPILDGVLVSMVLIFTPHISHAWLAPFAAAVFLSLLFQRWFKAT